MFFFCFPSPRSFSVKAPSAILHSPSDSRGKDASVAIDEDQRLFQECLYPKAGMELPQNENPEAPAAAIFEQTELVG